MTWLRRVLAEFCHVLLGEFGFSLGIANKTLRFGSIVLLAPVALLLHLGCHLTVAQTAYFLGHTMLVAPPSRMVVYRCGCRIGTAWRGSGRIVFLAASQINDRDAKYGEPKQIDLLHHKLLGNLKGKLD